MDPEQTFLRVQERFSQMLTPKVRAALEYMFLFIAITLFCILVVMHANYVQQPGCSSELSGVVITEAQLIQIKITSAGLWSYNDSESNRINSPDVKTIPDELEVSDVDGDGLAFLATQFWLNWIGSNAKRGKLAFKFWKPDTERLEHQAETSISSQKSNSLVEDAVIKGDKDGPRASFSFSAKETLKAAVMHFEKKWYRRISFICRHTKQIIGSFQKLWNIAGIHLNLDIHKWMQILHLDKLNSNTVQWLESRSIAFEPTYLYTLEKGYFMLPESAKARHNIRTMNISISARHSCFGNRWQQLLINRVVGYDTILINSLRSSPGQGYLYNYQTKEFYNISYAHEPPAGPAGFGDYLVTKCGVLMMSLFVFFTTTMSVSFTLRETQTRMLKFTVQLQHHARHRLPTFQLIFVHVIESLVFVPIMIGILFFLFEFYDDQLLAFMVLILVWLCELFTLISVRTPISMKFFPRFFLLYFLVFHIYFFSYAYGFSYLALSTTAAFMQHLILYFWNRFEVPALQRFMQHRRSQLQQHLDFHITSSTILASTLHITRLNTRNQQGLTNTGLATGEGSRPGSDPSVPQNGPGFTDPQGRQAEVRQEAENDQGQVFAETPPPPPPPRHGNPEMKTEMALRFLGKLKSNNLVVDLSHFGRIRVTSYGYDVKNKSGQGCDTVFVTPTARTIDIAHAWVMVMENLNLGGLVGKPYGTHQHFGVDGLPVTIGVGNIISEEGFSLLMSPGAAPSVWKSILSQGAIPMGSTAWEKLRVTRGRPAPGMELTKEFNVLEACLWNSISLNKGCYKGQETISRLITYDGVKQRLWGVHLSAAAEPGNIITVDGKKVGKLTSYASGRKQSEHFGLGYIKRQAAAEGDTVVVGENINGIVVEVPFLAMQRPPS
ncbi:membralin-like protein [Senna tora]|uniref:Membralin-like protein n=2 Tax=Magnoliopsida TaxID=3398 RepID=A0A834SMI1_9FABA|nr:membralin-like protein [Senna tora]